MAAVTGGIAAYCNAGDLGNMVIDSFTNGRRKRRMIGSRMSKALRSIGFSRFGFHSLF